MLATNPSSSKSADTSTEKEAAMEFPEDVTFPIVAKVMVNFYKRAETIDNEIVYKPVVKKLKYEIMMNKEDFASKKAFEGAVVRETDATKLAKEECIGNPRFEVAIQRKENQEQVSISKMELVVRRLDKLIQNQDRIVLDIREQVVSFKPGSAQIKLLVNNVETSQKKARISAKDVTTLQQTLNEQFAGSVYNATEDTIKCSSCKVAIKTRPPPGKTASIISYFKGIS